MLWVLMSMLLIESGAAVCVDPHVRVRGDLEVRWLDPVASACEMLTTLPDRDPTAEVIVTGGDELAIEVHLPDGRTAVRRVSDPELLARTLVALLTVPRAPPPPSPEPRKPMIDPLPEAPAASAARPGRPLAIDVGLQLGGRIADGTDYVSVSPELWVDTRIDAWIIGLTARWELAQESNLPLPDGFEMETLAAGIALGRRLGGAAFALDALISPRLVLETQSFGEVETTVTAIDLRIGATLRGTFEVGQLSPFVGVDIELSPSRIRRDVRLDPLLPPLPTWNLAVSGGFAWEPR